MSDQSFPVPAPTRNLQTPLVSVVIPSYNRAGSIERAVQSVIDQDYPNFEIIIVDDGSTDNTADVVGTLDFPGLRYFKHDRNRGGNAARNTGARKASGDFVAFQDSDDFWESNKLSIQIGALLKHQAHICFCAFNRRDDGVITRIPKPQYNIQPECAMRHSELLRGSFISCQTLVVSRPLLMDTGLFNEQLPRLQDWDLCLRLAKKSPIVFVDEALVQVDVSEDSVTRQVSKYAEAVDRILDLHAAEFSGDPQAAAMLCINVAADALRHGRFSNAAYFLGQALRRGGRHFPAAMQSLYRRR